MDPTAHLTAPTPPAYGKAIEHYQNQNKRFHYARPEQKVYQGRSAIDSIISDIKYSNQRIKESYSETITPGLTAIKTDNLYTDLIKKEQGLYQSLMNGLYKN